MTVSPLYELAHFGQSVWCDDIGRELLLSGRLQELIVRDGVSGVTSNPTIFLRAITSGQQYDEAMARFRDSGASVEEIAEGLMLDDVRRAADILWPVYRETGGRDGWVSIEIDPELAHDCEATVAEALRVRVAVARENVMVKVPATDEGVTALRHLIALGCPVNVTLIFSLTRYRQVIEAYLQGLEMRRERLASSAAGLEWAGVRSVASFFLSRIDTLVDARLSSLMAQRQGSREDVLRLEGLLGRTAVALAKVAYAEFQDVFSRSRWAELESEGAQPQRLLWASTSTKNPAYSDILYVEALIGANTVTTLPLETMAAFRDHGKPAETLTKGVEEAKAHLAQVERSGIDLDEVGQILEREGLQIFVESARALRAAVERKIGVSGGQGQ